LRFLRTAIKWKPPPRSRSLIAEIEAQRKSGAVDNPTAEQFKHLVIRDSLALFSQGATLKEIQTDAQDIATGDPNQQRPEQSFATHRLAVSDLLDLPQGFLAGVAFRHVRHGSRSLPVAQHDPLSGENYRAKSCHYQQRN
jgi:hypothetical protein